MKRLLVTATLSAALATGATAAQASHPTHPPTPNKNNTHSKRCAVIKRAFIVTGDHASFAGTKNSDGTYTGDLTLAPNHANYPARKSGVDAKNHTPITLHLNNAKVTFSGGATDLSTLQATDQVKVIGKIPYAKKGGHGKNACTEQFGSDRYDSDNITIRKVVVNRPSTS